MMTFTYYTTILALGIFLGEMLCSMFRVLLQYIIWTLDAPKRKLAEERAERLLSVYEQMARNDAAQMGDVGVTH